METEDTKESIEELSTIFSTANFPSDSENIDNLALKEDEDELNIGTYIIPVAVLHRFNSKDRIK